MTFATLPRMGCQHVPSPQSSTRLYMSIGRCAQRRYRVVKDLWTGGCSPTVGTNLTAALGRQ
jgi:hypothetical protein